MSRAEPNSARLRDDRMVEHWAPLDEGFDAPPTIAGRNLFAELIQIWIDEINFVLQSQASLDNGGAGRRARSWLVSEALSAAEGE